MKQNQVENQQTLLSSELDQNILILQSIYKDCSDLVFRSFFVGETTKAFIIYIEGLSNIEELDANLLSPLMDESAAKFENLHELLVKKISVSKIKEVITFDRINHLSLGSPVILLENENRGYAFGLQKWKEVYRRADRRIRNPWTP